MPRLFLRNTVIPCHMYATHREHHQPIPTWLLYPATSWPDSKISVQPEVHLKYYVIKKRNYKLYYNIK